MYRISPRSTARYRGAENQRRHPNYTKPSVCLLAEACPTRFGRGILRSFVAIVKFGIDPFAAPGLLDLRQALWQFRRRSLTGVFGQTRAVGNRPGWRSALRCIRAHLLRTGWGLLQSFDVLVLDDRFDGSLGEVSRNY